MQLPFEQHAAIVIGRELRPPCLDWLLETRALSEGRLLIGINSAARMHDIRTHVQMWIDRPCWRDQNAMGICDRSVWDGDKSEVPLEARGGRMPSLARPWRLTLRPNTAVVAALWAMSVGCSLVVLVACAGTVDAEHPEKTTQQYHKARDELLAEYPYNVLALDTEIDRRAVQEGLCSTPRIVGDPIAILQEYYR